MNQSVKKVLESSNTVISNNLIEDFVVFLGPYQTVLESIRTDKL